MGRTEDCTASEIRLPTLMLKLRYLTLFNCLLIKDHDIKTEQPATFWLERAEEVHVSEIVSGV